MTDNINTNVSLPKPIDKINLEKIKYIPITIIKNEFSISDNLISFFSKSQEHQIQKSDTIILKIESELIELGYQKTHTINSDIEFKYYSFGYRPDFFPKTIKKNSLNKFNEFFRT